MTRKNDLSKNNLFREELYEDETILPLRSTRNIRRSSNTREKNQGRRKKSKNHKMARTNSKRFMVSTSNKVSLIPKQEDEDTIT